jgi:hypothetical protein
MKRGYYTIDNSDLYWYFIPKYLGDTYVKGKVTLLYKKGVLKDTILERENYKLYLDKIQHWERYEAR